MRPPKDRVSQSSWDAGDQEALISAVRGSTGTPGACSGGLMDPWASQVAQWEGIHLPSGDTGSIPRSGGSPGEGNGNPCQCSCLGNPMDRGAWRATVHGFTKHWTRLSTHTCISLDTTGRPRAMEHSLETAGIRATRTFGFGIS